MNNIKLCIFCKEDEKNIKITKSREHIFPYSIGGNLVLNYFVCKNCNDYLGNSIDVMLTDCSLIKHARFYFKIKSHKGKIPNPFKVKECMSGNKKVIVKMDDNGCYKGTYDLVDNKRILPSPPVEFRIREDMDMPTIGILKIAYELGFYWLGDNCFNDEEMDKIRIYLRYKNMFLPQECDIDIRVGYITKEFSKLIPTYYQHSIGLIPKKYHIALLFEIDGELYVYIRIFSNIEGLIRISRKSSNYNNAHFRSVKINAVSRVLELDSLIKM